MLHLEGVIESIIGNYLSKGEEKADWEESEVEI